MSPLVVGPPMEYPGSSETGSPSNAVPITARNVPRSRPIPYAMLMLVMFQIAYVYSDRESG